MRDQTEISKRKAPARYAAHDVMGYLLDHRQDLSRSHSKIAEAILQHPTASVEKPIEELVTWIGVSAPTVTRFSRAIGCDGLRDLKLKVMSSMRVGARYPEPATPPATLEEVVEHVVVRAQRSILGARRTVDSLSLERAIELLARSRMIYAFGSGGVSSWHGHVNELGVGKRVNADHVDFP
jgi:DNA-binding MurR/RpiR family transcriptional regulator